MTKLIFRETYYALPPSYTFPISYTWYKIIILRWFTIESDASFQQISSEERNDRKLSVFRFRHRIRNEIHRANSSSKRIERLISYSVNLERCLWMFGHFPRETDLTEDGAQLNVRATRNKYNSRRRWRALRRFARLAKGRERAD